MIEVTGRAPRGACELKYFRACILPEDHSRAPRGACELKCFGGKFEHDLTGRAPRGACELKSADTSATVPLAKSRPSRGV